MKRAHAVLAFFFLVLLSMQPAAAERSSFEELTRKAEAGDAEAQFQLAGIYNCTTESGQPSSQYDESKSSKWYLKAAEQGHADAQYAIGQAYSDGKGVEKDAEKGFQWYMKAAKQDHGGAFPAIAGAYERGEGVAQSWEEAYYWRKLSSDWHCSLPKIFPDDCDRVKPYTDTAAKHLTPGQIAAVDKRAAEYLRAHPKLLPYQSKPEK